MPWYVMSGGRRFGPYDESQLKAIAQKGRIYKETQVSESTDGPWIAAGDVTGVFSEVALAKSPTPINVRNEEQGAENDSVAIEGSESATRASINEREQPRGAANTRSLIRIATWLFYMGWSGILGVVFCSVPTFMFAAGAMTGSVEWSQVCINNMMPWLTGLNTCIFLTLFGFTGSNLIILFIRGVKAMEETASLMQTVADSARIPRP